MIEVDSLLIQYEMPELSPAIVIGAFWCQPPMEYCPLSGIVIAHIDGLFVVEYDSYIVNVPYNDFFRPKSAYSPTLLAPPFHR